MKNNQGFTLLELMITIAILAILVTIAAPSMQNMIHKNQVSAQIRDLNSTLQEARSKAMLERRAYTVDIQASTKNGSLSTTGTTISYAPNSDHVNIQPATATIVFDLLGGTTADSCYVVAHTKNTAIAQVLRISKNGSSKIHTDKTSCT